MLDSVLKEVESGVYQSGSSAAVAFPAIVAMSHMWLGEEHPDPHARNLREKWLPALEWYYSERVREIGKDGAAERMGDDQLLEVRHTTPILPRPFGERGQLALT